MITAVVVALVSSVLFAAAAPAFGRRLPPGVATRLLVDVRRDCRRLRGPGSLVVVDSDEVNAFTTPLGGRGGRRGRVVVTTALLRALEPAERRVVLAAVVQQCGERLFEGVLHDYERAADRSTSVG